MYFIAQIGDRLERAGAGITSRPSEASAAMPGQPSRPVVPVLGMHRSGTSLTTGILNALGVSLSEDLMPPTQANAIGYFESLGITAIHDRLLAAIGSSWHGSQTLRPFPQQWWRLPQVAPFKERLKALVADEIERVPGVWGFKDPRTSRLLPMWNEIFTELALEPRYVLVGRHPLDVAKSLETRDGLNPLYSELLWLEHTADAVIHSKPHLRAIVEYSRWFENPIGEAEYLVSSLGFPMPGHAALQDVIGRYVSSELRHHASTGDAFALPFSRDMYQALLRRDRASLEMLADLFAVTSAFTSRVANFALQAAPRQTTPSSEPTP